MPTENRGKRLWQTARRHTGRAQALRLSQNRAVVVCIRPNVLTHVEQRREQASFPMTSASSLDITVIDEGNVELCVPVMVDSETCIGSSLRTCSGITLEKATRAHIRSTIPPRGSATRL